MPVNLMVFGLCQAIDGDKLRCGQDKIRLLRINTPEVGTPGADAATDYLKLAIEGKIVTCTVRGGDAYRRLLGECFTQPGPSLSDQLLERGLAKDYRK